MTTVFYTWAYGGFIEIQSNLRKKNFIERIKAPIFLEAVLAIKVMNELQSNLEESVNPRILKDDIFSRTDPSILTLIEPVVLDRWSFPSNEINKPLLIPVHSISYISFKFRSQFKLLHHQEGH